MLPYGDRAILDVRKLVDYCLIRLTRAGGIRLVCFAIRSA
jgi:hypothetical protein